MRIPSMIVAGGLALASLSFGAGTGQAERAIAIPAAALDAKEPGPSAVAVLAGGCFWGMEGLFERVKGVKSVTSGYAGGTAASANYEDVSSETTGHAEAVRIVYDPAQISYATLLRIYFSVAHDPTQFNRQGPDNGLSYRSAIFPVTPAQNLAARAYIAQLSKARSFAGPIVTRLETGKFYPAEAHHQDFMRRNPGHPYIMRFDVPKVAAYRVAFPSLYR
jgi:peptide-methionine (S)-S-oxide reductase